MVTKVAESESKPRINVIVSDLGSILVQRHRETRQNCFLGGNECVECRDCGLLLFVENYGHVMESDKKLLPSRTSKGM